MNSINPRIDLMIRRCLPVLLGLALCTFPGCDKNAGGGGGAGGSTAKTGSAGGGGVAIVDLDKCFRQVGWTDQVSANITGVQQNLQMRLDSFAREIESALKDQRDSIAKAARLSTAQAEELRTNRDLDKLPLTKEQRDEWIRSQNNAAQYAQQAQQQANQLLQQRRQQVFNTYTESVKPIVRRVAAANGYTVVLTPPSAFWYDGAVDITDKVTDEVQKDKPAHTLPEPPTFNLPHVTSLSTGPTTGPTTMPGR